METIQQQIGALQVIVAKQQVSVKRQRFAIVALACVIVAGGFVAAVRPPTSPNAAAEFFAKQNQQDPYMTSPNAAAAEFFAKQNQQTPNLSMPNAWAAEFLAKQNRQNQQNQQVQIGDATFDTIICKRWVVVDKYGKVRIDARTDADGQASVYWLDKDEKLRIGAGTSADGSAAVVWLDKDEKTRIAAGTFADGTVILPTKDENPPKKP